MHRMLARLGLMFLTIAVPASLLSCAEEPSKPKPLTFEEQLAATSAYANFTARGIAVDLDALELHDLAPLGSTGTIATARVPDKGVVGFAFDGNRSNVGKVEGYLIRVERDGLLARVVIESSDSLNTLALGFTEDGGLVSARRQVAKTAGPSDFDWDRFFDCVEARSHDLPTWVDVTCGASLFLCVVGSPAGCFATAVCAVVYIGPCVIDEFEDSPAFRPYSPTTWSKIISIYR